MQTLSDLLYEQRYFTYHIELNRLSRRKVDDLEFLSFRKAVRGKTLRQLRDARFGLRRSRLVVRRQILDRLHRNGLMKQDR